MQNYRLKRKGIYMSNLAKKRNSDSKLMRKSN
jgi:hypothetical protein